MTSKFALVLSAAALSFVAMAAAPRTADASGDWAMMGVGCTIDPTSAPYKLSNGFVEFSGTATGTIIAYCPITPTLDPPNTLEIQATDNSAGGYVQAWLMRVNANDGSGGWLNIVQSTDGNGLPHPFVGGFSSSLYNPNLYRYYLLVYIVRNSSSDNIRFWAASVY